MVQGDFSIVSKFRPNQTDTGALFVARFEEPAGPQYRVSSDPLFPERSVLGTLTHTNTSPGNIVLTSLDLAPRLMEPASPLVESALALANRRVAGALLFTIITQTTPYPEAIAINNTQPPRLADQLVKLGFNNRQPQLALAQRVVANLVFLGPNLVKTS